MDHSHRDAVNKTKVVLLKLTRVYSTTVLHGIEKYRDLKAPVHGRVEKKKASGKGSLPHFQTLSSSSPSSNRTCSFPAYGFP